METIPEEVSVNVCTTFCENYDVIFILPVMLTTKENIGKGVLFHCRHLRGLKGLRI